MIDVRLTATNPEDSSLVPVPCNARGELLTVAPKIEVIPNDVEVQGDLTVTGLINGSIGVGEPGPPGPQGPEGDPGVGVPLPYGEEGTYLRIKDGIPTWGAGDAPTPPEPSGPVIWTNINSSGRLMDSSGNIITPEDPYTFVTGLDSWEDKNNFDTAGSSPFPITDPTNSSGNFQPAMNFEFEDMYGKVLTLFFNISYVNSREAQQRITTECSFDSDQITQVAIDGPVYMENKSAGKAYAAWSVSYLFSREVAKASHSHHFYNSEMTNEIFHFRGWEVDDAGFFAMKQLQKLKLGMTSHIDLSRPTQD